MRVAGFSLTKLRMSEIAQRIEAASTFLLQSPPGEST